MKFPSWLPALLLPACVLNPKDGTQVSTITQSVTVSGYTIVAYDTISVRAASTAGGPFTEISTTVSSGTPVTLSDGVSYYAYSATVQVPAQHWAGDACSGLETFVRVRSQGSGYDLRTFDELGADGQSVGQCFVDAFDASGSSIVAILECDSPSSPGLRLHTPSFGAPFAHVGDVTISTATDLETWACLETLDGDLTIPDSALTSVALPVLSSVTGDVSLTYTRPGLMFLEPTRPMSFPALTTIGGGLFIDSPAAAANQVVTLDAGLDALTSVGGDIAVAVDTFNCTLTGLAALTSAPGDVEIITGNGDTAMSGFLGGVTSVGGDLHVDIGHSSYGVFPSLVSVTGDFEHVDGNFVTPGNPQGGYGALMTVGGDFTLAATDPNGAGTDPIFTALTSVGGTLTYEDVGPGSRDALYLGGRTLDVGGLTVTGNPALDALGGANITVLGNGPITVTNNPSLCTSSVSAFVATQAGWGGVLTALGNDDGC